MKKYVLSLDQGTTSSRAILFDHAGDIVEIAQQEFTQIYPKAGWVEHDPKEILKTQIRVMLDVCKKANIDPKEIASIGITNQRETTVVWDKVTGEPVYNAVVWQCRRTADDCESIMKDGFDEYIKENTGLIVDAYFSGTKLKWILDQNKDFRKKAKKGDLLFGTIDTWLIWNLSNNHTHVTEYSNASRTMLYNIKDLTWDNNICEYLNIPMEMLPKVQESSGLFAELSPKYFGHKIPISGVAGDQQAALFGQACFEPGMVKNTYGTGCFMLMQTGEKMIPSESGLLTTIAWGIDGKVSYALEGSVFVAGAAIQWLRDELQIIDSAPESEQYCLEVEDTNGVYVVPAFAGLGAPYWDMYARGTIVGLTRGVNKAHLIRATVESLAYQSYDLIQAMEQDSKMKLTTLKVDGGASANNFLMQFQADLLHTDVIRPSVVETTALGAAYLSGLAVGFWDSKQSVIDSWKKDKEFKPNISKSKRKELYNGWKRAIGKSRNWIER